MYPLDRSGSKRNMGAVVGIACIGNTGVLDDGIYRHGKNHILRHLDIWVFVVDPLSFKACYKTDKLYVKTRIMVFPVF